MASGEKKNSVNLKRYRSKRGMNIGIFLFAVIFIYLVVTVAMYATSKQVSLYEVREGSIVKDNSYNGLVLREEVVVPAENDGYVSYFLSENSKVRTGSKVYALSPERLDLDGNDTSDTEEMTLSSDLQNSLALKIQNFSETYTSEKFSTVYSLKNEISDALQNTSNQSKTAQLDAVIAERGNIPTYQAPLDGILSLTIDGYESLTEEEIDDTDFEHNDYESIVMADQDEVKSGDPIYKLITSENWSIYVPLDENSASDLSETSTVKTKIGKDNESIWADLSILQKGDAYYGKLSYDNSVVRYAQERFLNVELILEDQSGLKIPKSAVIKKKFYLLPSEYLTNSGNSSSYGVLVYDGEETVYTSVDLYGQSEDGDYYYLNFNDFSPDTVLIKPESTETMTLSDTEELKGVYNLNKGYAVFNPVVILCENDEYYIIESDTPYGPSNYDHIAQDGSQVKDNEVVFQ